MGHPMADAFIVKHRVKNIFNEFNSSIQKSDFHQALEHLVQLQKIYDAMEDLHIALEGRREVSYEEFVQQFDLVEEDSLYS